ncbi:hypothetical protein MLD38_028707 [Melastoma candidum]|uniref:Uncharacterized protein n=1 Tax=Melastoma candidum TaxID=119954 RepID=A0ACB9N1I6_9MYRT|nr:hypothetical protein MLD38_028707 [Melastoma candidum]
MDDASYDVNHLDADVLLPPRKRLLAGLKKQSLDVGEGLTSPSLASCSSSSPVSSVFEARMNRLMNTHANNPSLTLEEIADASESAALTAANVAKAARAAAEEKAAVAVKKVAAAKSALDLVASFSEERVGDEGSPRRNKLKKQVPIQSLYRGRPRNATSSKTDEEIARKLHQVINSSPRIVKNPSTPDSSGIKRKNHDVPCESFRNGSVNGGMVSEVSRVVCNGQPSASGVESEDYEHEEIKKSDSDDKPHKKSMDGMLQTERDKASDEKHTTTGKKRGRVKLKKLPLSICTSKDKANVKNDMKERIFPHIQSSDSVNGNMGSYHKESAVVDGAKKQVEKNGKPQFWRCQELEAPPAFGKRNKTEEAT